MNNTLAFNEMNDYQQLDWFSDMLGESCFSVRHCSYFDMSEQEQQEVKSIFFSLLDSKQIEVRQNVINDAVAFFDTSPLPSLLKEYAQKKNSVFSEAAERLTKGRKVTIIKYTDFGFPTVFHTTIERTEIKPYAQHKESLKIIHRPKRKRSLFSNSILPYDSFLVYDGWLDIDKEKLIFNVTEDNEHMTVKQTKYVSFDDQFFIDTMKSINQKPLIKFEGRK